MRYKSILITIVLSTCLIVLFSSEHLTGGLEIVEVESIFFNGKVYTMIDDLPVVQAVAVNRGKIVAVGSDNELLERFKADEKIDLKGNVVIPGLIDAHCHFSGFARNFAWIDLVGTESLHEVLDSLEKWVKDTPPREWVRGRGWDQNDWKDSRFPTAKELDRVSPENPVMLTRICGHAAVVNSLALELCGITADTPDPEGGKIVRDGEGNPTGLLLDNAIDLVEKEIPPMSDSRLKELLIRACNECLSVGLVGCHEMGIDSHLAGLYLELYDSHSLPFRITAYYSATESDLYSVLAAGVLRGARDGYFSVVGVKFFADGSLGARSAAMLEDYSDAPGNRGILVTEPEVLLSGMMKVYRSGYQIAVHAIGDRANRLVLDIFEKILKEVPVKDPRFRIEHAQVVAPEDIERFCRLGVIPSMQFVHATSDMPWAEDRLGPDRIKGAYAWRSFKKAGCRIPGGSDFPVESINPFLGIYAAITRKDLSGNPAGGWYSRQCLSVEEAVRSFTVDAAYASFEESIRGSLEAGKFADFVVLPVDIMSIETSLIPEIKPLATVVGGEIVFGSL